MNLKIETQKNGWTVTVGDRELETFVYQIKDDLKNDRKSEVKAFQDLLTDLISLIGPDYDGFSKYNLVVKLVKGDET